MIEMQGLPVLSRAPITPCKERRILSPIERGATQHETVRQIAPRIKGVIMSRVHNNLRFLKLATISLFALMLIVGCANQAYGVNNPNSIDGSADINVNLSVTDEPNVGSYRNEVGDQFNETVLDDINNVLPESDNQDSTNAEKVEASEGCSQHEESEIGSSYYDERSLRNTPVPPIINVPDLCIYTSLRNVNCRASDYVESSLIAILMQGEDAKLLYLNPTFTHGKFELATEQQCWIALWLMDGPSDPYKMCQVYVVDTENKSDSPVCSSGLNKASCAAAGGNWVDGATGAPYCNCP